MKFREDYNYHVMNCHTGRLVYSCDTEREALEYANKYASNSGYSFMVLQREAMVYSTKSVVVERV